jgi:hypothetical protein
LVGIVLERLHHHDQVVKGDPLAPVAVLDGWRKHLSQ